MILLSHKFKILFLLKAEVNAYYSRTANEICKNIK